jgi:hypothetical protein
MTIIDAFYEASSSMLSGIDLSARKSALKGTHLKPVFV